MKTRVLPPSPAEERWVPSGFFPARGGPRAATSGPAPASLPSQLQPLPSRRLPARLRGRAGLRPGAAPLLGRGLRGPARHPRAGLHRRHLAGAGRFAGGRGRLPRGGHGLPGRARRRAPPRARAVALSGDEPLAALLARLCERGAHPVADILSPVQQALEEMDRAGLGRRFLPDQPASPLPRPSIPQWQERDTTDMSPL